MITHDVFFRAFLTDLGITPRTAALRTLAAVSIFESSQGDEPWWNPLASTLPCEGSRPLYPGYKGACAQIYPSFPAGVSASVELFSGPHWADVRAHLTARTTRGPMLDAFTRAYTWAHVDFRPMYTTAQLDTRRAHQLRGPS